jgi:hypothetical protein
LLARFLLWKKLKKEFDFLGARAYSDGLMKFNVMLTYRNGHTALLSHRGKTSWCKRVAQKHCREWQAKNPKSLATVREE